MTNAVKTFSFRKGWRHLPDIKKAEVKAEIKAHFGINPDPPFYRRMNGEVEPRWSDKIAIEEIFMKHGVRKRDIWGE